MLLLIGIYQIILSVNSFLSPAAQGERQMYGKKPENLYFVSDGSRTPQT